MAILAIYDLYSKIVIESLSVTNIKLNKCRLDFMIESFMLYLIIPSRINFSNSKHFTLLENGKRIKGQWDCIFQVSWQEHFPLSKNS